MTKKLDLSPGLNILRSLFLNGSPILIFLMAGMPTIFNGKIQLTPFLYGLVWSLAIWFLILFCFRNIIRLILDLVLGDTKYLSGKINGLRYSTNSGSALSSIVYFRLGGRKFKYLDASISKNYHFLTKHRGKWKLRYYPRSGVLIELYS